MEDTIKVGDFVWHKTGGLKWVVDHIKQNNQNISVAVCSRVEKSKIINEEIPTSSLTKENPTKHWGVV